MILSSNKDCTFNVRFDEKAQPSVGIFTGVRTGCGFEADKRTLLDDFGGVLTKMSDDVDLASTSKVGPAVTDKALEGIDGRRRVGACAIASSLPEATLFADSKEMSQQNILMIS